ncbi:MAG TPA: chemotaxis protein CheD [Methylophilaceae bacterium]|nr:chemotaxis protein CheD [Methylophilaceae bacterium]
MRKPVHVLDIFLQPGEHYFGDRNTQIRTILGSCVSMTVWHPHLLVGGMSHFMMPTRQGKKSIGAKSPLDGKYADEAIKLMLAEMKAIGALDSKYQVKLFGGGDMFPNARKSGLQIGEKNVEAALRLLKRHNFACQAMHLGGTGHRNLVFRVWNGNVWVKHTRINTTWRAAVGKAEE